VGRSFVQGNSIEYLLVLQFRIPPGAYIFSLVNDLLCAGDLCNGLISRPGESYGMCVSMSVVKCSMQLLYLRRIDTKPD
jgi:hypothetical protein